MASSKRPKTPTFLTQSSGSSPSSKIKKSVLISIDPSKEFLGINVTQLSKTLRERGKKNFELAKKYHADPTALPVDRNQFIEMLYKKINESPNSQAIQIEIEELRKQIKLTAPVGDYGRFSSIIDSVEMIDLDETVIYFPIGKNPGNLPSKQYVNPQQIKNPLVTAMGGGPELWYERIAAEKLTHEAEIFYQDNKKIIDELMAQFNFMGKFDSFYLPDAVVDVNLTLSDGAMQPLAIFESNATQVQGGQLMIAAPSGLPKDITQAVSSMSNLKSALHYTQLRGKDSSGAQAMTVSVKKIYDDTASDFKKIHATPMTLFVSEQYQQKKLLAANQLVEERLRHLASPDAIDASLQLPMTERGDITFLLGTEFDSDYAVFQNSRDTASVSSHFHCYAIKLNEFLKDSQNTVHTIPLFRVNAEKTIFRNEGKNFPPVMLEKLEWPAACYRLSMPLQESKDKSAYLAMANLIKEIQDTLVTASPDCTFCYITRKSQGEMQFYIGVRKVIQNYAAKPLSNKTAESLGLQPPFNGSLEFAGINTMKGRNEFKAYGEVFQKSPEALLEIQKEACIGMSAEESDVIKFEEIARDVLSKVNLQALVSKKI